MHLYEYARTIFALSPGGAVIGASGAPLDEFTVHGRGRVVRWLDNRYFAADIAHLLRHDTDNVWPEPRPVATFPVTDDERSRATAECHRCWLWNPGRGLFWRDGRREREVEGEPVMAFYPQPIVQALTWTGRPSRFYLMADVLHLFEHRHWPWDEPADEPPEWD